MRIRIGRGFWTSRIGLFFLATAGLAFLTAAGIFTYFWVSYSRMIDARMNGQVFTNTSRVFAAPQRTFTGQALTAAELTAYLQRAGYTENGGEDAAGSFRAVRNSIEVRPGPNSYFAGANGLRIDFIGREVTRIRRLDRNEELYAAELEPEVLTNLFDSTREKRRIVHFADLPKHVVDAVLSAEDKRFFEHPGFDPIRILGAAWADLRHGGRAQGASTISMQVARSFFFTTERTWKRKLAETLVALQLEQRFSKEEIFELYANQIYIGNRGSFAIRGFGEGAQAYFGKDVRELGVGEAAFLAGIIRAPNRYANAERVPERCAEARDRVLKQMVENNQISQDAAEAAHKAALRFAGATRPDSSAPYFVDMVKDHLLDKLSEAQLSQESFRIYTTLDPALQRAAAEAVAMGMKDVDKLLAKRYAAWRKKKEEVPQAQVALIALDPRTGEIKALVGGRDYGQSQLNRVLSRRQPGSAFKPFVYAAAFSPGTNDTAPAITPVTTVVDEPTTFFFDDKEYTPNNYGATFYGTVTLRDALRQSLNVATVKVAEMTGYGHVVEIARQIGLAPSIRATPAIALGAYEMTPLEVSAGYTVFANGGSRAEPLFIRRVVSAAGTQVEQNVPRVRPALDPRVAYMVTNLLEDVVNRGTAAGVRARGFTNPAAGKTGTSHDGWFAGFTSNLLCVVWVGFDDNRELGLAGSASAAPIWTEFMKRAVALPAYRDTQPFPAPEGMVKVPIDPETLALATPACPITREEVFLAGSEPTQMCPRHGGHSIAQVPPVSWLAGVFGEKDKKPTPPSNPPVAQTATHTPTDPPAGVSSPSPPVSTSAAVPKQTSPNARPRAPAKAEPKKADAAKKKGLLDRIFGIFGSSKQEPGKEEKKKPQ